MRTLKRPVVMSTRGSFADKRLLAALAAAEGQTISVTLHSILMPAVRERLAEIASESEPST